MSYPMFHMPLTHLFITSEDPPKLKLDLVVYTDAGKKITLQNDPPKTYNGDKTIIHYKVESDDAPTAAYFHHQFEFTCTGKPHIVETIVDGTSRHTVVNSSDRAEPI